MYRDCLPSIEKLANAIVLIRFGAKLTSVGKVASYYTLDCYPKQFQPAFEDFKKYFQRKTGVDWDE